MQQLFHEDWVGLSSLPSTPASHCVQRPLPRSLLLPKPETLCLVQPGRVGEDLGPQEQAAPVRAPLEEGAEGLVPRGQWVGAA